ncbi:MAG: 50S ribosomal protein L24 [Actinomycetota bacterium]|nr:50S ribosomal protein L24 [Actinomycetota bacterium]
MARLKARKGDKVLVIAGKDKGKKGKVLVALPKRERVIVEGVNVVKRHTRPTQRNPQGGIIEKESAIHVSNVQLICPNCGQPTRIGKREISEGKRVRICKKCGQDIDKV